MKPKVCTNCKKQFEPRCHKQKCCSDLCRRARQVHHVRTQRDPHNERAVAPGDYLDLARELEHAAPWERDGIRARMQAMLAEVRR